MSDYDSYSSGEDQEFERINYYYESKTMPDFYNDENKIAACDLMAEAFTREYEPAFWLICKGNAEDESFFLVLMMVNHNDNLVQHNCKLTLNGEKCGRYMNPIFEDIKTKQEVNDLIGTTYYGG